MNLRKPLLLLLIVAVVAALPLLGRRLGDGDRKAVTVVTVERRVISPSILASGFLAHEQEVMLSSEVIGRVAEVLVEEGDAVHAGQMVLRVDDTNLKASLEQAEAAVRLNAIDIERQEVRITNLRAQWARTRSLHEQRMVGDEAFDDITNQLDLAEIDLKSSRERLAQARAQRDQVQDQLNKTRVVAPLSGVVTSLDIKEGETAIASSTNIPGSSLMTIADPASIYTEVLVDEADVASIAIGQTAEIVAIAYPDAPMRGVVQFIANTAKVAPGRQGLSFTVKIQIIDHGAVVLRPGMSCRAEIFTRQDEDVLAVPIQALRFEEDRAALRADHFVFVNDNGVARKTSVTLGLSDDAYQEIRSGLQPGQTIVSGPDSELRHLLDGDRLDVSSTAP